MSNFNANNHIVLLLIETSNYYSRCFSRFCSVGSNWLAFLIEFHSSGPPGVRPFEDSTGSSCAHG